jgi:hypothetical protein
VKKTTKPCRFHIDVTEKKLGNLWLAVQNSQKTRCLASGTGSSLKVQSAYLPSAPATASEVTLSVANQYSHCQCRTTA